MFPSSKYENQLRRHGYTFIAGLDEAGRGSWAGPLVAGAVILHPRKKVDGICDSKLLAPEKRKKIFLKLTKKCLTWSVGLVSPEEIDELGIIPANRLAFERAVKKLDIRPDYLLVDGLRNFNSNIHHEFIVQGDRKILSIAAASIIAKVIRDQILTSLHKIYPEYNFHEHKGYGTKEHLARLQEHGFSEIHRLSFRPMASQFYPERSEGSL